MYDNNQAMLYGSFNEFEESKQREPGECPDTITKVIEVSCQQTCSQLRPATKINFFENTEGRCIVSGDNNKGSYGHNTTPALRRENE